jgi:cation transport ATPase
MSDEEERPQQAAAERDRKAVEDEETEKERLDRNLMELLGELRVALPGVQVLFAFLLAVPFQAGFVRVTAFQRDVYFFTLCCALLATVCLIAPTPFHRLTFRLHQKRALVAIANRLTIAGLGFVALAMTSVILLISDVLFGTVAVVVATLSTAVLFVMLWGVLPLRHRRRRP